MEDLRSEIKLCEESKGREGGREGGREARFMPRAGAEQGCQVGDFIAKFSKTGEIWTPFG